MAWLSRQLGFDQSLAVPVAKFSGDVHSAVSGRYAAAQQHHGHGHGGDDHGHSHGGHGAHGAQEPMEDLSSVEGACASGDLAQLILLWAQGVDISNRFQQFGGAEAPPIMWAALKGHIPIVKFLVDRGVDPNIAMQDGQTALMWASTDGQYAMVETLLKLGARPGDGDVRGYNAYFVAVQASNLAITVLLCEHTAPEANGRDADGHTLMHWAAYRGSRAVCEYLHEVMGVPVDGLDNLKRTPLIWAAREGHSEVCAYLLSKGARVSATDSDGQSAQKYAEERHHRQCVMVLTRQLTEVRSILCSGSVALMIADRAALLSGLFGVVYTLIAFAAMHFLPSIFTNFAFGLYWGKNMIFALLYKVPESNKSASGELDLRRMAVSAGIPRTYAEAIRSLDHILRLREPGNLFAMLTFLAVQNVSILSAQLEASSTYWVLLAAVLLFAWYTKHVALKNVVTPGTIQDSAVIRAVHERKYKQLQVRITDQEKHVRLPLRSFYCYEIDEIVKQYDSFSTLLDAPIGENNLLSFFLFLVSFLLLQAHVLISSWTVLSTRLECDVNTPPSGPLYGFLFHALPCAQKPLDDSWMSFIMPSTLNAAGIWIIHYSLATLVMAFVVTMRALFPIMIGCTRKEMYNPTAPTADGDMVPIFRNGRCIYSEGSAISNVLMLLAGRFGHRWRGLYAVPAPPSP